MLWHDLQAPGRLCLRPHFILTACCSSEGFSLGWNPASTLTAVTMVSSEITRVSSTNHWGITHHPKVWEVNSSETGYASGDQHRGSIPHGLTHLKMEPSGPPWLDGIPFIIFTKLLLQKGYYGCPYRELVWMHALTPNERWNRYRSQNRKGLGDHLAQPFFSGRKWNQRKGNDPAKVTRQGRLVPAAPLPTTVLCAKLFPRALGFVALLYGSPTG